MEEDQEKLISALWESVQTIARREARALGKQVSPAFTSSLAEVLYSQMGIMASDLEAFASHGKRTGISMEDVKLCARRNDTLYGLISEAAKEIAEEKKKK